MSCSSRFWAQPNATLLSVARVFRTSSREEEEEDTIIIIVFIVGFGRRRRRRRRKTALCSSHRNGKNDDDASSSVGEQSVLHDAKQSSYDAVNDPPTYSVTEREAMQPTGSLVYERLSPAWRVLLLSDGSVTRHLSLLGKRGHTHRALGEISERARAGRSTKTM